MVGYSFFVTLWYCYNSCLDGVELSVKSWWKVELDLASVSESLYNRAPGMLILVVTINRPSLAPVVLDHVEDFVTVF